MQFSKIMVPFDGSEQAHHALDVAAKMVAGSPEASLHVVSVVASEAATTPLGVGGRQIAGVPTFMLEMDEYRGLLKKALDGQRVELAREINEDLADAGVEAVVDIVAASSPTEGIVHYAEDNGCDLIVMGRRGLGALRGMLGSVSYGVLHCADIPVMTVK